MAAGWAVLLLVLAAVSARRDAPTVPDQITLVDAVPAVDRAAGAVLAAAGADTVVELGPLVIGRDCPITPVRAGAEATRDVTVHVRRGEGPAALRAVATALPSAYRAQISRSQRVLRAGAGEFVLLRGTTDDEGTAVTLRASSGCRPAEGLLPPGGPASAAAALPASSAVALPGALTAALDALGGRGAAATVLTVPCPDGGAARATTVDRVPAPVALDRALDAVTADATVVQASPTRYAYRLGNESVIATTHNAQARLTTTTPC